MVRVSDHACAVVVPGVSRSTPGLRVMVQHSVTGEGILSGWVMRNELWIG